MCYTAAFVLRTGAFGWQWAVSLLVATPYLRTGE
jgi:hypothetical protein